MDTNLIADVIKAADGRIVGRIRFQKICYLLEQLGLGSDSRFVYHYYGPYSEEVSRSLLNAKLLDNLVREELAKTDFGAEYSIYELTKEDLPTPDKVGELDFDNAKNLIGTMKAVTSVVIELAATIHWLREKEGTDDWLSELKKRKSSKATDINVTMAEKLLADLNL